MNTPTSLSPHLHTYQHKSKNPYWDKIKALTGGALTDFDTESLKGQWKTLPQFQSALGPDYQTHVEIGCNGGHVTLGRAQKNPKDLYIGLDWKPKQIFLANEKAQKRKLENTLFLRAQAERMEHIFGPEEIDFLCVYFPDPWPKKKQKKHRYLNANWFLKILPLLAKNAQCEIKTDHKEYFEFILENLTTLKEKINLVEVNFDLHRNHPNPQVLEIPEVTLFEKLFIKDKLPIHKVVFTKNT